MEFFKESVSLMLTFILLLFDNPRLFQHTLLSGEGKVVSSVINPEMLEFTGPNMDEILEPGQFRMTIGSSSVQGIRGVFRL